MASQYLHRWIVLLTFFSLNLGGSAAYAEGSATVKGLGNGKASLALSTTVGTFFPSNPDSTGFKNTAIGYGPSLDLLSTLVVDAAYTQRKGAAKGWAITIPLTIEYGLQLAALHFDKIFPDGSAWQLSGIVHIDFFRLLSIGGGGYQTNYSGTIPAGMNDRGYGAIGSATLTLFPGARFRPLAEVRMMRGSMRGTEYMLGITVGGRPPQ